MTDRIESHVADGAYRKAREAIQSAQETSHSLERALVSAEIGTDHTPAGDHIIELQTCLERADEEDLAVAGGRAKVLGRIIQLFTKMRARELVESSFSQASTDFGEDPWLMSAYADALSAFDERPEALEFYEKALRADPEHVPAQLGRANVLYMLGHFDQAADAARTVARSDAEGRHIAEASRLLASIASVATDHDSECNGWVQALEATPRSDGYQSDLVSLALALARADRWDEALSRFREAWRLDKESGAGRYARKRIEHLEAAGEDAKRVQLKAFPTTAQKRNHCGPAVLELSFRFLGIELGQDEIAAEIKQEAGTPMYAMYGYLKDRQIDVRRITASPERIRQALDLGLPVIVQEEYSTTAHVAVITGYETRLGTFLSQDPMTHRISIKSFEFSESAGDLFGNGGLLILGQTGETEELGKRCDAAQLIDEEHLLLVDECDRQSRIARGNGSETTSLPKVVQLCSEALRINPGFKLAWNRRAWAHRRLSLQHRSWEDAFFLDLFQVRTRYSGAPWTYRLHGEYLLGSGRHDEAFASFHEAQRIDPNDAYSIQSMGECSLLSGDLAGAEKHLRRALTLKPDLTRAIEHLACTYVRQIVLHDENAREGGRTPLMTSYAFPESVRIELDAQTDELAVAAELWLEVAMSTHENNPFTLELAGALALRRGNGEKALAHFTKARQVAPNRPLALQGCAEAHLLLDDVDTARSLMDEALESMPSDLDSWLRRAELHRDAGAHQAAADILLSATHHLRDQVDSLLTPLYGALAAAGSQEAAAAQIREIAQERIGDDLLMREAALLLDRKDQKGHAIGLLRYVVEANPHDVEATYRLGVLLSEDLTTRDEALALLERTLEFLPDWNGVRCSLAHLYRDRDPDRALEILDGASEPDDDPWIIEARSAVLASMDQKEDATRTLRRAAETLGEPTEGMTHILFRHMSASRYQRLGEVAHALTIDDVLASESVDTAYAWVGAHNLSHGLGKVLPEIRQLVDAGLMDEHVAFYVFYGCRSRDYALARKAAEIILESNADPEDRFEWRVNAAHMLGKEGELSLLHDLAKEAGESAERWAQIAFAYNALNEHETGLDASRRSIDLDPSNKHGLSALEDALCYIGDVEGAMACARSLLDLYPYEHVGPERLGILYAKAGDVEEATGWAIRAVDAAPYCHISHRSIALAMLMAGHWDEALRHAKQSEAIELPDDEYDDIPLILAALERKETRLEEGLAALHRNESKSLWLPFKDQLRLAAARDPDD